VTSRIRPVETESKCSETRLICNAWDGRGRGIFSESLNECPNVVTLFRFLKDAYIFLFKKKKERCWWPFRKWSNIEISSAKLSNYLLPLNSLRFYVNFQEHFSHYIKFSLKCQISYRQLPWWFLYKSISKCLLSWCTDTSACGNEAVN
jgi:hypothetical protein